MTEAVDEAFEAAVEKIEAGLGKVKEILDDVTVVVPPVIEKLPPLVKGFAEDKFEALVDRINDVYDMMMLIYTERGSASAVRTVANRWTTEVGAITSDQAGKVTLDVLPSNGHWSGTAADKYTAVVRRQVSTLGEFSTSVTAKLHTELHEIADVIRNFWTGIASAYAIWVIAMAGSGVTIATAVGAVPGLIAALAATAAFVNELKNLYNEFSNTIETKLGSLTGLIEVGSIFHGDQWPPTTTDYATLSDASVRDGDESEWAPA